MKTPPSWAWQSVCLIGAACMLAACKPAPSASQSGAAAPAPAPQTQVNAAAVADLAELKPYVGAYPSDSNVSFLEEGVLAERLKRLLGPDYSTLLMNLRTVSPLMDDAGRWFITGNRPHEGGVEEAAVVVDSAQNAVRVWMLHGGQVREWVDPAGAQVPWPKDVQTMLDNHHGQP